MTASPRNAETRFSTGLKIECDPWRTTWDRMSETS